MNKHEEFIRLAHKVVNDSQKNIKIWKEYELPDCEEVKNLLKASNTYWDKVLEDGTFEINHINTLLELKAWKESFRLHYFLEKKVSPYIHAYTMSTKNRDMFWLSISNNLPIGKPEKRKKDEDAKKYRNDQSWLFWATSSWEIDMESEEDIQDSVKHLLDSGYTEEVITEAIRLLKDFIDGKNPPEIETEEKYKIVFSEPEDE